MESQEQQQQSDEEEQNQAQSQDAQEAKEEPEVIVEPPIKTFPRTSILLSRSHDDKSEEGECSYCDGKRLVDDPVTGEKGIEEKDLKYQKLGFTSTKLNVHDLEHCLNSGFTRCGTYIYQRSSKPSCCEVWQYRVDINDFQYSDSQKKVIRKFHKYLNYGDIHYQEEKKQEKVKIQVKDPNEMYREFKDKVGQMLIQQYLVKIEQEMKLQNFEFDLKYVDLRDKIMSQHKITYNQQKECLSSNILMIARNDQLSIADKCDEEIKSNFVKQVQEINEDKTNIESFEIVNKGKAKFFNILLTQQGKDLFKTEKAKPKNQKKEAKKEEKQADPKYTKFLDYLEPRVRYEPVAEPKHHYTIEFHRAVYTEELYELYNRYEKAVHKKDRDKEQLKRFVCSSPVFDPSNPDDFERMNRIAPYNYETVDDDRTYKDEPVYPGLGSFHYYHRIDGKLVAMGVNDITNTCLNSQYFIYDPDYSFLCLGVVGAIHEIEFMKMVQKKYNPDLRMYQLGELVLNCPKVNYKLNYKPGILICPRTKQHVKFDDVKPKLVEYSKMPIAYKKTVLDHCQLVDLGPDAVIENELMAEALKYDIVELPFLYENSRMLPISCLQQGGKDHIVPLVLQMIQNLGLLSVQKMVLELKFQKKPEEVDKKEDKNEEMEKNEGNEEKNEGKNEEKNEENEEMEKQEAKSE